MIIEQELVQLLPDNRLLTVSTNHINIYKMPDAHIVREVTCVTAVEVAPGFVHPLPGTRLARGAMSPLYSDRAGYSRLAVGTGDGIYGVVIPPNETEFRTNCIIITLLEFQSDFTTAFSIGYGRAFAQSKKSASTLTYRQNTRWNTDRDNDFDGKRERESPDRRSSAVLPMMDEESGRVVQAVPGNIYITDYSLYYRRRAFHDDAPRNTSSISEPSRVA
jgi:hypothetical protein